jgi:hypothetical protein
MKRRSEFIDLEKNPPKKVKYNEEKLDLLLDGKVGDCLVLIFSNLNFIELYAMAGLSKRYRGILKADVYWRHLVTYDLLVHHYRNSRLSNLGPKVPYEDYYSVWRRHFLQNECVYDTVFLNEVRNMVKREEKSIPPGLTFIIKKTIKAKLNQWRVASSHISFIKLHKVHVRKAIESLIKHVANKPYIKSITRIYRLYLLSERSGLRDSEYWLTKEQDNLSSIVDDIIWIQRFEPLKVDRYDDLFDALGLLTSEGTLYT